MTQGRCSCGWQKPEKITVNVYDVEMVITVATRLKLSYFCPNCEAKFVTEQASTTFRERYR